MRRVAEFDRNEEQDPRRAAPCGPIARDRTRMNGALAPSIAANRRAFAVVPSDIPRTTTPSSESAVVLSIIIPTFNEAGNVGELLRRIDACLPGVRWEALVVDDDSPDGTADLVLALGERDERIRCLRRVGRRGLSGACLEGMAMARGMYYAIMDADLQHDERLLPDMLKSMETGNTDLVVGSRYVAEGCVEAWNPMRRLLSRAATGVTQLILRVELSDPMSGFFMIRRETLRGLSARCSNRGFKLLLDLVASSPLPLRVVELPYRFAIRQSGKSKLGAGVVWSFVVLLGRQLAHRVPMRFFKFCAIGGSGVLVHFTMFWLLQQWLLASFPAAQTGAVLASMTTNFYLNNRMAFGNRRLQGADFVAGLSSFAALCAFGAVANVVAAELLHRSGIDRVSAATVGILVGAVCNYLTVSSLVWRS